MLSSGRRGANSGAMVSVQAESWLTNPKNDRRSVRLVGVGNCSIASVIAGSVLYPSADKMNPANCTSGFASGVESNFVIRTSLQKLPNVTLMLNDVIVINDYIVHDTSKTRQTIKGFVHTTIVVFRY